MRKQSSLPQFSLLGRLTLFFCFVVLLVTITLSMVVFYQFGEKINEQIRHNLDHLANNKASEISSVLQFDRTNLLSWRGSSVMLDIIVDDLDKRIVTELTNIKHDYRLQGDLYVFNEAGVLIASTQPDLSKNQLPKIWQTEQDYTLIFKHDVPFIHGSIIAHVARLKSQKMQVQGYLVMAHSWGAISRLLAPADHNSFALRIDSAASAELFTEKGIETIDLSKDFAKQRLWLLNHIGYLGSISKARVFDNFSFQIAAFMPEKRAQYALFELTKNLLLAAVLVSVPMILLVSLLARKLVRPIKQLTASIRTIENSNDLSIRVPVSGHDEVADLGHAFNRMTQQLGDSFGQLLVVEKELEQLNSSLEKQVIDRTAELALKNAILHLISQGGKLPCIFDQLLDENGKHLRHGAAPSLPKTYQDAIDELLIEENLEACEASAVQGKYISLQALHQHNYWLTFRRLAYQAGLHCCRVRLIKNKNGLILGALALYHRQNAQPVDAAFERIEPYVDLALLAIEREQAELNIRLAATAFESREALVITDTNGVILRINNAFTELTGYSPEETIGKKINMLKSGHHDAAFYAAMWESLINLGVWQGEIWDRRKNGEIYPKWLTITAVKGSEGVTTHYIATHIDITERKAAAEEIKLLAFYDPLTQLPNRRLLQERLKHSINVERRDGKQMSLLMLDLDRFKAVNDSLGHLAGDELLQQVAARIKARLREVDMVARLGGDEFIVLLEDIAQPEDAARVADDIITDLTKPFCLSQSDHVLIGASIGICLYPQHGSTPEMLLDHADTALYQAKDAGRGCFAYFSEELTLAARERMAFEIRLRRAIEQQELRVFYQPLVDIASGRIVGAEALVRWQDPIEGLVSPLHFIPIAEEIGLIVEIGAWVLQETCRQGKAWLDAGLPPLTLEVNVSSYQFHRNDFCTLVTAVLGESGFPGNQLELEITESGLMGNQEQTMHILNSLRAHGIHLAIDDFGTGYSSLAYLKHFPIDKLKIDKSFIDDIPFQQDDMEITATIISMGHILGFKVLAEGVETPEQLAFLQEKGCDMYQGYIKSKPLPAAEFAALLANG